MGRVTAPVVRPGRDYPLSGEETRKVTAAGLGTAGGTERRSTPSACAEASGRRIEDWSAKGLKFMVLSMSA
jgi:hypothetical protein